MSAPSATAPSRSSSEHPTFSVHPSVTPHVPTSSLASASVPATPAAYSVSAFPAQPHPQPKPPSPHSHQQQLQPQLQQQKTHRCPICDRTFGRDAELQRHAKRCDASHPDARKTWACCGLPLAHPTTARRIPQGVRDALPRRAWGGRIMVGGCGVTFTRKDAYQRHLNNREGVCWGEPDEEWCTLTE